MITVRNTICNLSLIMFIVSLLSGCSIFSPVKTDNYTTYVLNASPQVTKKSYRQNTLLVSSVEADYLYNTNDMAYTTQAYQVDYYAKNKWSDTPAKMLQPLLLKSLRNSRHFHAVTTSVNVVRYDYILNTRILELRQVFTRHAGFVIFKLHAEIVNAKTGQILASKEFISIKCMRQFSPYGGVVAANKAVSNVLTQLNYYLFKII